MVDTRNKLADYRRIVVKVGSALLADKSPDPFAHIAGQIAALKAEGREVVLVSSGAIALGLAPLGYVSRPKLLAQLQAAAAVGQTVLMARWSEAFSKQGVQVAQVLLTHADMRDRERYLNARSALAKLLEHGIVPIINENDTVSVREIKFGDNDELAAHICGLVDAELVALLTQTNGLFTADPLLDPSAKRIAVVAKVSKEIESCAGGAANLGLGGMSSKVRAAKCAAQHGAATIALPGREPNSLVRAMAGDDLGTLFAAPSQPATGARKRWIALTLRPRGVVMVDDGAREAILRRASLLAVGVVKVKGEFVVGDAVEVADSNGRVFARGLVAIDAPDLVCILGKKAADAAVILGCPVPDEIIHRDNLVIVGEENDAR